MQWNAESDPRNRHFVRYQDLSTIDFVQKEYDGSPCIVVSHPWRFPQHPDRDPDHPEKEGQQLAELVEELRRLSIGPDVLVFYDFCSLPQLPRTPEQKEDFEYALSKMHLLYTSPSCFVLVL